MIMSIDSFGGAPAPGGPDPSNMFLVGITGDKVVIMVPAPQSLTKAQALNLAAWLSLLADPGGKEFKKQCDAVTKL
jgi:hypothetical protein